eukprot:1769314-Pleurochrysis_carterae.AAC.1
MKVRRANATNVCGVPNAKSIAASLSCSSISPMRIMVLATILGVCAPISLIVFTARSNAGLKS